MKRISLVAVLFLTLNIYSQKLFFKSPGIFQNLPSVEAYHVFQDSRGLIWVCTDAGICLYDGNTLKTFTTKDGISENVVLKTFEDKTGKIWFNSLSGYFFYYFNNRFYSINANEDLKKICGLSPLNSFYIGKNDTLYCTSIGYNIIKIPPQDNYSRILFDSVDYSDCNIYICSDQTHPENYLVNTGSPKHKNTDFAFSLLANQKKILIPYDTKLLHQGGFTRSISDKNGNIYIPTGKRLSIYKKSTGTVEKYDLPSNYGIIHIYVDKDSDLWVGTGKGGGYLFRNSNLNARPIHFLSNLTVSSIMMDREGTIWAATTEKGIFQSMNKRLLYFDQKDDQAMYFEKQEDRLHISYFSTQILSLFKNDSIRVNNVLKEQLPNATELYSYFTNGSYSYFGVDLGLYLKNCKEAGSRVKFLSRFASRQILGISKDTILGINPRGFIKIYKDKVISDKKTPFPILFAVQLKNKKILFCTRNNTGIFELKNNALEYYLPGIPQLKVRINCLVEDPFGNLWIATNEHGLYCYDHQKKMHHFNNNHLGDKINTLMVDHKNQLWAGTNNGLNKIVFTKDLKKIFVTNFNKSHGIPSDQITKLIEFKGKIGCITKDLFFYFDNDQLQKNNVPPLTYIESVLINDQKMDPNHQTDLNYNKNNIHIFTTLVSYRNYTHKYFMYKLAGYDLNWHYSTTGDIQYTNLPHGKYTFYIYGLNNDKLRSIKPAIYTFTIKKPFWLKWWFIVLELIVFITVAFLFFKFWKNKIEKREHDKVVMNKKIAEFKMTALRAQMNPHFIFNAISSIQHYILKQNTYLSYNYLAKFSLLIRTILDNSKEEYIALSQEINTLKLYIELEQIRFKQPFEFILQIDEALKLDTYIPTMLIQPYIENSIWHGLMPKKTNCILYLKLKKMGDNIFVTIKDNGIGRNNFVKKNNSHVSKGMSLTEQRIKELEINNKKKFDVTVFDLTDNNGNAVGTKVQIIIPLDL